MAVVGGVAVPVVDVVDVVSVRDRDVAAAVAVGVLGVFVRYVVGGVAFVPVAVVLTVQVSIVDVVDVVSVWNRDVAAAVTVGMGVCLVFGVDGHPAVSFVVGSRANS
ncbi:hypothetical protein GCM10017790_82900 [Amycolatopsis oliviviridis]|uniref:Uncharacterized protein n=1 Tax=Amycolatopsis oliviviridis TaxID=1471590 RepID=A0ABQ3MCK8_9PSEU|nr:hypothetical protein GCM10017790_82900 [Amycolatopsis oliviviridis]